MEDGQISSGALIGQQSAGFTGSGYVRYRNAGAGVQHDVAVPSSGSYDVTFRYSLPSGQAQGSVEVNGQVVDPNLVSPPTGSWGNWQTVTTTAPLIVGTELVALSIAGKTINVDSMVVTPR